MSRARAVRSRHKEILGGSPKRRSPRRLSRQGSTERMNQNPIARQEAKEMRRNRGCPFQLRAIEQVRQKLSRPDQTIDANDVRDLRRAASARARTFRVGASLAALPNATTIRPPRRARSAPHSPPQVLVSCASVSPNTAVRCFTTAGSVAMTSTRDPPEQRSSDPDQNRVAIDEAADQRRRRP